MDFYIALSKEMGRCPSLTELSEKYGKAKSTVYDHLTALERKGYLVRDNGVFVLPKEERDENTLLRIPLYRDMETMKQNASDKTLLLPRSLGITEKSFALISHTYEMIGEGIVPGDTLLFHPGENPENGKIVLAAIQGEDEKENIVLRRYQERNGFIELVPENDTIGRITTHKCRIIGILELKLRKY